MCIARPFVSKVCCSQFGPMCNFFQYRKKSPSFDVRMNMIPEHAGVWSLQSFQCRKWGNIENSSIYHKNIKTLHKEIESWKSIFWACWHHWSMTLKGWVTEFQFHEVALCFLEQPLTFSHFRPSQFSWFVDVIVIVLSSLLHITFFRLYWRPNSLSKDRPRH